MPLFFGMWARRAAGGLLGLLTFGITLPVWAFVAGYLFFQWDKSAAVKAAIVDLVAGAELDALRETAAANARLAAFRQMALDEERRRSDALAAANAVLTGLQSMTARENERQADELDELRAQPAPDGCAVTPDLLRRLRNR